MESDSKREVDLPEGGDNSVGALAVGQRRFVVLHLPEGIGDTAVDDSQAVLIRQTFGDRFRVAQVRELLPVLSERPLNPVQARQLLQEAGYPTGLPVSLIASEDLVIQATVVGKMLEQAGFQVDLQVLDSETFNRKTVLSHLD